MKTRCPSATKTAWTRVSIDRVCPHGAHDVAARGAIRVLVVYRLSGGGDGGTYLAPVASGLRRQASLWPTGYPQVRVASRSQGRRRGQGNLSMTTRDMTRIGELFLRGGRVAGRQVIDSALVRDALAPHVAISAVDPFADAYGYMWYSKSYEIGASRSRCTLHPATAATKSTWCLRMILSLRSRPAPMGEVMDSGVRNRFFCGFSRPRSTRRHRSLASVALGMALAACTPAQSSPWVDPASHRCHDGIRCAARAARSAGLG